MEERTLVGKRLARIVQSGLKRFLLLTAPTRMVAGFPVTVTTSDADRQQLAFAKIGAALALLEQFHPRGSRAAGRYIKRILVPWAPHVHGSWFGPLRLCELSLEHVTHATPEEVACTIVHEAMHARLERLGFSYDRPRRQRLEAICIRSEIAFVERLPQPRPLLDSLHATLGQSPDFWSDAEQHKARISALHELGVPRWLIVLAERLHRRSAA